MPLGQVVLSERERLACSCDLCAMKSFRQNTGRPDVLPALLQGYAVLLGACFRSIPQILRIVRAKSASGVSLSANIAELLAYSITVAYNLRLGAQRSARGSADDV